MKALAWETVVSGEARRDLTQAARASFETTGLAGKSTLRAPRRMVSSRRMASCAQESSSVMVACVFLHAQLPYLRHLMAERPPAVQHLKEYDAGGPNVDLQGPQCRTVKDATLRRVRTLEEIFGGAQLVWKHSGGKYQYVPAP